jgi:hypothetical protein
MRSAREVPEEPSSSAAKGAHALAITDGEVNFLWWFIQGSIMNPETWDRLMRGGGFCERHAWVHLSAETTFREWYLLGPAILYRALIEQSLRAFRPQLGSAARLARRHEPAGSCFLCEMHLDAASSGVAPQRRLDQGRDTGAARVRGWARTAVASACVRHVPRQSQQKREPVPRPLARRYLGRQASGHSRPAGDARELGRAPRRVRALLHLGTARLGQRCRSRRLPGRRRLVQRLAAAARVVAVTRQKCLPARLLFGFPARLKIRGTLRQARSSIRAAQSGNRRSRIAPRAAGCIRATKNHFPRNAGLRFSTKAATPSR